MLRALEWSPNSRMRETKESGCSVYKYGEIECTGTSILNSFVVGVEIWITIVQGQFSLPKNREKTTEKEKKEQQNSWITSAWN